ncbi:MAG: hypothetical protein HFE45_02700 [Oscillospiraceae bacterium]|jgi:hypothetical protein|nr:hypothetical protein [Oscillospiraceae bacterium]
MPPINSSLSRQSSTLIKQLLADEAPHSTSECARYVRDNLPEGVTISQGIISTTLHALVYNTRDYFSPNRGFYQKKPANENGQPPTPTQRAAHLLKSTVQGLDEICTINLRQVSSDELEQLKKLQQIAAYLEERLGELQ